MKAGVEISVGSSFGPRDPEWKQRRGFQKDGKGSEPCDYKKRRGVGGPLPLCLPAPLNRNAALGFSLGDMAPPFGLTFFLFSSSLKSMLVHQSGP